MRIVTSISACLVFSLPALNTYGQTFPEKPVRILIGFPGGTSVDIVGRALAQKLSEKWGQQVIVDNRAGAGGNLAADLLAKAAPDGHTLLLCNNGIAISATLYKKLQYDAMKDLTPVTELTFLPHVLVVNASLPTNSIKDLVALAKAKPGQVNFGSGGFGNSDHMAGELFKYMSKVNMVHIPYKGGTLAMNDVIGGQIALYFSGIPAALPFLQAGRLKALGTSGTSRSPALPNVPTIAEAGIPGYEVVLWNGFVAPAGTPKNIVEKIAADTAQVMKLPDVANRFTGMGLQIAATPPAQFEKYFREEITKWGRVIRDIGLQAE